MQTENKITAMLKSDIKFKVRLLKEDQARAVNIQSVEAYFINRDLRKRAKQKAQDYRKHFKFLRRYPIEPWVNHMGSTVCCLNNPGIYGYNTRPVGICAPVYAGFGLEPHFHEHHCCFKNPEVIKAPVYYTADRMAVEVYFPAWMQRFPGEYDLVITTVMYDNKYHLCNSRTFTTSYESIVTLTENSSGIPGGFDDIEILPYDPSKEDESDPGGGGGYTPDPDIPQPSSDKYVKSGEVVNKNGNDPTTLVLDLENTDNTEDVKIDLGIIADWYEGA